MTIQKNKLLAFRLALALHAVVNASITDSIYSISEIEIRSDRLYSYLVGSSVQEIDSQVMNTYNMQSLAEILKQESLISINSYGPGGVAGASSRGGGSNHTSVIWNGINIQSPMNGGVNYSVIPVFLIDEAHIQYGGASTLFGSGTATGSIHINNTPSLNSGLRSEASVYAGSNNNYTQSVKISQGNMNFASITKFYHQNNENNFRFKNTEKEGSPYEYLDHGRYEQYAFSHSNTLRTGKKSWMGLDIWFVDFDKDIPPLMNSSDTSKAVQHDKNAMYSLYFKYSDTRVKIRLQSGGFYNENHYEDPAFMTNTLNRSYSFINLAEFSYVLSKQLDLGFILEHKHERAHSDSYTGWEQRNIFTPIFSVWYKPVKKLSAVVNIREEIVSGDLNPLVFSAGLEYNAYSSLALKGHVSRNYSLPTFNDLYWKSDAWSAGNPDLKPESGWSGEAGAYLNIGKGNLTGDVNAVGFYNSISNWIRWVSDESFFWTPQNIQEGESKGLELSGGINLGMGNIDLKMRLLYSYTDAIIKKWDDIVTEETQMWYVPKHQIKLNTGIQINNFGLNYSHSVCGKRTYPYAEDDLPSYGIANIAANYAFHFKTFGIKLFVQITNLYNEVYQIKEHYAMPLRQYNAGITFSLSR